LKVGPRKWTKDGECRSWFYLSYGPGDEDLNDGPNPWFELSRLTGVGGGELCLWLDWKDVKANKWKPVVASLKSEFEKLGICLDGKSHLFFKCTPNQKLMAAGLENDDLDVALKPVLDALDRAARAMPLIDKMLTKARSV
jgi:hypothetical protein